MSPPGFWRSARVVAGKDLRLEWRTLETLSQTGVFSLAVLVVFSFAFGAEARGTLGAAESVPGVLWTIVCFASVVALARSIQLEQAEDALGGLLLAPIDPGALYAGKLAASLVKLTLLEALVVPLTAVLFDYDLVPVIVPLAFVVLLHGLGLAELGTLLAAVAVRLGRGEALLSTLLFPAAVPLLISAVKCTTVCLAGEPLSTVGHWLLISAGFDVLYLVVALLTFEFVLEE